MYDRDKLGLLSTVLFGGQWGSWVYRSEDAIATVMADGYIYDAADMGMNVDDSVIVVDTTNHLQYLCFVGSLAGRAATLTGGMAISDAVSGSLSITDGSTTVSATSLNFSGATVTDGGSGEAQVTISDAGGSSGLVLISSGQITEAVASVALSLPSEYIAFELELIDVKADGEDSICVQFSSDGGETWHDEDYNYPLCYLSMRYQFSGITFTTNTGLDTQGYVTYDATQSDDANTSADAIMKIFPGSASSYARVRSDSISPDARANAPDGMPAISIFGVILKSEVARQNFFRFGPYFGDSLHMTQGYYFLRGKKLP